MAGSRNSNVQSWNMISNYNIGEQEGRSMGEQERDENPLYIGFSLLLFCSLALSYMFK